MSTAEELLHRAVELDSNFVQARWSLGLLFTGQKRYEEAIEHFERILLLTPTDFAVHRHLGNLYKRTENLEKADEHYGYYSLAEREQRMRHLAETSAEQQLKKFLGK